MRDFLQGYEYWRKHTSILEPKLIKKADVAVANSLFYADYCAVRNPESYYIGQGCNFDLFNTDHSHPRPPELQNLSGPIIGYVGAVDTTRLDLRIIEIIATAKPSWNIVLVGPEDTVFASSSLHQLPNVHFTGRRPLESLPAFVEHFDVCLNPQLINTITKGNYPLKIDEYLAMGRPVVATRTPTMKLFEEYTWLADQPEDYPRLIETALQYDTVEERNRRSAFAREHTWENSMKEVYKVINNHLTRRP
jgi:teichuronic acid biosynthesis glycosyltransferase TuaH